ncbi:hypothetical protein AAE478_003629 [Parahypoxylon ruwenzoriense]
MPPPGSISNLDWTHDREPSFDTIAVHGGQEPDPVNGSRAVPLYQTAAYNFSDAADGASKFAWSRDGYVYTRMGNPTNTVFENRMTMLEGGVGAVATASGHAAQFMALTQCCEPGHNFISTSWLYGGSFNQFRVYLNKFKISVKWVVGNDPAKFDEAIDENTRAIYIETISNPKHSVPDIAAIAAVAHKHGIPLVVDNTFGMGGYLCQPIKLGADIVTHSATKWIGGHGTSMGGIVIDGGHFDWSASGKFPGFTEPAEGYHGMRFWETYGNKALAAKLRMDSMRDLGPCMSPFNAWLFLQGLETLPLRGQRTVENTQKLAEWLEAHPCVSWVLYPGLKSHPDYELAQKIMPKGAGGVLTFGVAGKVEQVRAVVDNLKMASHLANVGDCKTLIIHPWVTTHQQMPDEEKIKGGVTPDLLRVSLGIEDFEDIRRDFEQAFKAAGLEEADKSGVDPFRTAMNLVSEGFMGKLATASLYSYIALIQVLKTQDLLKQHDVEIEIIPVLLGGINAGSGNKPPWTLPAKAAFATHDSRRSLRAASLDPAAVSPPGDLMEAGKTQLPLRALHYVRANYPPATYLATWQNFLHAFWTLHRPPNTADSLRAALAGVASPSPSSSLLSVTTAAAAYPLAQQQQQQPLFTAAEVDRIVGAASSQELKDALRQTTDTALKHGAFGAPWMWVTNASTGRSEPFFGSDRWSHVYEFLGLPYQDVALLPPRPEGTKPRL